MSKVLAWLASVVHFLLMEDCYKILLVHSYSYSTIFFLNGHRSSLTSEFNFYLQVIQRK